MEGPVPVLPVPVCTVDSLALITCTATTRARMYRYHVPHVGVGPPPRANPLAAEIIRGALMLVGRVNVCWTSGASVSIASPHQPRSLLSLLLPLQ